MVEELVAVGLKGGQGVGEEVDRQGCFRQPESGVAFEELEYTEPVDTFGAGMDETVGGVKIATERLPKVVGAQLLLKKGGHGCRAVVKVQGGEGVVGGFDGGKTLGRVEWIAVSHKA